MTIPEGATHISSRGLYYKQSDGKWKYHHADEWCTSNSSNEWLRDNLKQLPTQVIDIPEGATHVSSNEFYYKLENDEWFFYNSAGVWETSYSIKEWVTDLKELHTPTTWEYVEFDASKQLPDRTPNRDEALQWLVDNIKDWPTKTEGCNHPFGWSWVSNMRDDEVWRVVLTHTIHDPITMGDWYVECQASRMNDDNDAVRKPKHYQLIDGVESIQVIACSLTRDEWRGFCLGNEMKYRLRAGKKDDLQQEIDKANEYNSLFEKYKGLNRDE